MNAKTLKKRLLADAISDHINTVEGHLAQIDFTSDATLIRVRARLIEDQRNIGALISRIDETLGSTHIPGTNITTTLN